jgi:hypothetical protein
MKKAAVRQGGNCACFTFNYRDKESDNDVLSVQQVPHFLAGTKWRGKNPSPGAQVPLKCSSSDPVFMGFKNMPFFL